MSALKLKDIFDGAEDRLGFKRMTGKAGLTREVTHIGVRRYLRTRDFRETLTPDTILIIKPSYLSELALIPWEEREKFFQAVTSTRISCIALSGIESPPDFMFSFSERGDVPMFTSVYDEFLLESRLIGLLREKIENAVTMHGALVNVFGLGIIIRGESGNGKTECACRLAERGHAWIADDVVEVERRGNVLFGRSHDLIKYLIDLKGKGIVDAKAFLGAAALCNETAINLVVELKGTGNTGRQKGNCSMEKFQEILGIKLPFARLSAFPCSRDMDRNIEGIARILIQ